MAARAEVLDPGVDAGDDLQQEYGLALKRRLNGLRNKLRIDLFKLHNQLGATGTDDSRLRIQYRLAF